MRRLLTRTEGTRDQNLSPLHPIYRDLRWAMLCAM